MLLDTSVLVRLQQPQHPLYPTARRSVTVLPIRGRRLHIVPQNLFELWVVATRPASENGLGMTTQQAASELTRVQSLFPLLPDTPAVFPAWEALVTRYAVHGKPAHDARLVAALQVHGLTAILTFDKSGFSRFPGLEVVHPADV